LVATGAALEHKAGEFRQHGVEVKIFVKDLFNRDEVFSLCEEVKAENLLIDVLVNDAGQGCTANLRIMILSEN
jgi:short-subunit dehydrogenase